MSARVRATNEGGEKRSRVHVAREGVYSAEGGERRSEVLRDVEPE